MATYDYAPRIHALAFVLIELVRDLPRPYSWPWWVAVGWVAAWWRGDVMDRVIMAELPAWRCQAAGKQSFGLDA